MPVEFLSNEQAVRYGQYHADPSPEQLSRFFCLNGPDLQFLSARRRSYNKLRAAVQLCTRRFLGTFLSDPTQVPAVVARSGSATRLAGRGAERLSYPPQYVIRPLGGPGGPLGIVSFDARQAFRLMRWLYARVTTSTVRPGVLFDITTAHLVNLRVVRLGVSLLARLIARVCEHSGQHVYRHLRSRLSAAQQLALEALLLVPVGGRLTPLEGLRTRPTHVSSLALMSALRQEQIRAVGVGDVSVHDVAKVRLARMARHAQLAWAQPLLRMSEERRLATLLVFVQALERRATDDVLDLFDGLMTSLALRGETMHRRERSARSKT